MFIAIAGTICSGRKTIRDFLIEKHGFIHLQLSGSQGGDETDQDEESTKEASDPPSFLSFSSHKSSFSQNGGPTSGPKQERRTKLRFKDAPAMLDYVTRQWTSNFVTLDLTELRFLELFTRRPFCLIVTVDAPITVRYQRYARMIGGEPSLHSFLEDHDRVVYGAGTDLSSSSQSLPQATPLTSLVDVANIKVTNVFGSLAEYHAQLEELNLLDPERTRPSWDSYFMRLASLAARRSNCMKRRVGAVLVRDKRIISTGYNGTPRGLANCNEGGCRRCNGGAASGTALEECVCLHAEENALLEAGRERVGVNAVLYCDTCPCLRCSVKIAQVGIKEVVYSFDYKMDEASARLLNAAGVTIRKHRTTSI